MDTRSAERSDASLQGTAKHPEGEQRDQFRINAALDHAAHDFTTLFQQRHDFKPMWERTEGETALVA